MENFTSTILRKLHGDLKSILLCIALLATGAVYSQNVLVSGATIGNGLYPDVGSAFTAINSGSQTGASIVVSILGNTTEAASAVLNQGAWNTLIISPSGGAARTIQGNIGGALIDLNGADRVSIDGLNTGGNSLTIDNTSNTAASTIRFINDAHVVLVQNCTILGANTSAVSGTVLFSPGVVTGNDTITFLNAIIDASGSNFPVNGVYSTGTALMENSTITFNSCTIPNFFSATAVSCGILAAANNTGWTISGCRFYQSATRTYTTANTHRAIQITSGNGHNIDGNIIGYATSATTGTYAMAGTIATRFIAIDLAVGTTTATSVQGNLIRNISLNTSSGAATTNGILCGINMTAGNVNVGTVSPNIIGGSSGTGLLTAVPTTSQGAIVGMHTSSTGAIVIQNNSIGGFSSSGVTAAVAGGVFGINVSGAAASLTITGNSIGNSTAENMISGTNGLTTGSSIAAGINITTNPSGIVLITNNTIRNFSSYGTGTAGYVRGIATPLSTSLTATYTVSGNVITSLMTSGAFASVTSGQVCAAGIQFFAAGGSTISNNTIANISALNTGTTNIVVAGITLAATAVTAAGNTVSGNTIYNLTNAGTGTTATAPPVVTGIVIRSGANNTYTIFNNMISLGSGQATNTTFIGIWANHGSTPNPVSDNIYYNTVNIEGTVAAGGLSSFCFQRGTLAAAQVIPVDIRNNIFTNTRSGGTGAHYAISNHFGAVASATGWSTNYNVLNATAANVGYWNAPLTFANWQTTAVADANSYSGITVTYVNSSSDLHLNMGLTPTYIESGAQVIAAVTTDFDAQARPGPVGSVNGGATAPDIGADEIDAVPACVLASTPTIAATLTAICSGGSTTLSIGSGSLNNSANWQWYSGTCGGTPAGTGVSIVVSPTSTTNYFVRGEGGCASSGSCGTVSITVNALPSVTASPTVTTVCSGSSVTLSGGGATSYAWTGPEIIADNTPFNATLSGTYTVTGTDGNGCTNTATADVTVNPLPAVTGSPSSTVVCSGTSVTLSGGGAVSYAWTGPETISDNTPFNATISGTYTVTGTDANGCMDTATASVTVNALPVVTASPVSVSVCAGTATIFAGGGAASYIWTGIETVADNAPFIPTLSATYTVTGTDANGCTDTATASVTVNALPLVTASPSSVTVCSGDPVTLSGGGALTYSWSGPESITDNVAFNATIGGTYTVTGTDANTCSDTASAVVTVTALPNVTLALPLDTACQTTTPVFALTGESPAGGTYSGPGVSAGMFDATTANLGYNVITYSYADSATGCSAMAIDSIWVDICNGVVSANAENSWTLYPNPADGRFTVASAAVQAGELNIEIYNATGQMVQQSTRNLTGGSVVEPVDLSTQPVGVYMIRIVNNDTVTVLRVICQ